MTVLLEEGVGFLRISDLRASRSEGLVTALTAGTPPPIIRNLGVEGTSGDLLANIGHIEPLHHAVFL